MSEIVIQSLVGSSQLFSFMEKQLYTDPSEALHSTVHTCRSASSAYAVLTLRNVSLVLHTFHTASDKSWG